MIDDRMQSTLAHRNELEQGTSQQQSQQGQNNEFCIPEESDAAIATNLKGDNGSTVPLLDKKLPTNILSPNKVSDVLYQFKYWFSNVLQNEHLRGFRF